MWSPVIARLFKDKVHRFNTGNEVDLSRNAVVGDGFDRLSEGNKVRNSLHEEKGENGQQASTVVPSARTTLDREISGLACREEDSVASRSQTLSHHQHIASRSRN